MKHALVFLFALVCLAFVAGDNRVGIVAANLPCLACSGCAATKVTDLNASPPITNGVQIIVQGAGVTFPVSFLTTKSGKCVLAPSQDGELICSASNNCEFKATYSIQSTAGKFHDSMAPCNWSNTIGGNEVLAGSIPWIAACNNSQTWATVSCYGTATSCADGVRVAELKFVGHCSHCTD